MRIAGYWWLAAAGLLNTGWVHAESEVTPGAGNEPEVTIIHRGQETIQEYRTGNQLYMIKVIPAKGVPYYLVDADGDGSLETRRNDLDVNAVTPKWVLFRWR